MINIDGNINKEYLDKSLVNTPSANFKVIASPDKGKKLAMALNCEEFEGLMCETIGINDVSYTQKGHNHWFNLAGGIGSGDADKGLYIMCRLNMKERFKVLKNKTKVRYFMGSITHEGTEVKPPKNGEYIFAIYRTQKKSSSGKQLNWNELDWNLVANTDLHKYNMNKEPVITQVYEEELVPSKWDYWACFIKKNIYKEPISMPGRACSEFNGSKYVYLSLRYEGSANNMPERHIDGSKFNNDIGQTFFVRFYNSIGDL